jgi:hypothetical protein
MAQTGFTPIQLYSTSTAAAAPVAGNLTNSTLGSELAINITDGKLFYKDNANAVQVIGWKVVPTTAGGTGLTTYTAGDLSYYANGTTFTKLAIGTTGQILTSTGSAPQWTTLSGVAVTTFSAGTTGFTPNSATSGAITLAGTLATTNGGTGLTSFTANSVFYASSTSAIGSSANLTFNGTTLTANDITDSSLTATRVTYAGTSGNLVDSANLTFDGTTLTAAGLSDSGNLTFTGTGNRIRGDFSNATASNRPAFQSSTTNGNTGVYIIPNGTATTGNLTISNNSAPDNSSIAQLFATSADVRFASTALGTGTNLPLTIYTAGAERLRVFTSGGVSIGNTTDPGATNLSVTGNVVIATSGNGIDFSATPGTGTSELFADYEEGLWSPILSDGTNNATMSVSTQGHYTKIGNTLFYRARVRLTSLGSVTGAVRVTGLPFTVTNITSNYGGGNTIALGVSLNVTAGYAVSQIPENTTTYVSLWLWDAVGGQTALQASEMTNTSDIYFSGQYQV